MAVNPGLEPVWLPAKPVDRIGAHPRKVSCPSRSGSIGEYSGAPVRAGRDRRIRTSASGSQSPLPCAAWLCLHIAGLSRQSSISRPTQHVVYIEKLSAQHFVSGVLLPHPLYTTAAPRLERVTSTRLVAAPTIPTLLGNRFNLYFACHHYLQRGNFWMPPITRRLRGQKSCLSMNFRSPVCLCRRIRQ